MVVVKHNTKGWLHSMHGSIPKFSDVPRGCMEFTDEFVAVGFIAEHMPNAKVKDWKIVNVSHV